MAIRKLEERIGIIVTIDIMELREVKRRREEKSNLSQNHLLAFLTLLEFCAFPPCTCLNDIRETQTELVLCLLNSLQQHAQ